MSTAKLRIMGNITVKEPDGEDIAYDKALLIEFNSDEDIRTALKNMKCEFEWEETAPSDQQTLAL